MQGWVRQDAPRRSPRVSRLLSEAVSGKKNAAAVASRSAPAAVPNRTASVPAPPPAPSPRRRHEQTSRQSATDRPAVEVRARARGGARSPPGIRRPGADDAGGSPASRRAVRGKKHKHEGTNCDDWYEVAMAGPWTVIAVSDGAGSKKLSRIGARVSCQEAVRVLTGALADHRLTPRRPPTSPARTTNTQPSLIPMWSSSSSDARGLSRRHLRPSRRHGASGPTTAAYAEMLTRRLVFEDLSGTLLVAAHTTVRVQGRQQSLVVACQIGDGVVAGLDPMGGVVVLGAARHRRLLRRNRLSDLAPPARTRQPPAQDVRLRRSAAGAAGDERRRGRRLFPGRPRLARLYADLVLNGILPPAVAVGEEALAEVSEHTGRTSIHPASTWKRRPSPRTAPSA